jgi:energy-coupling factor transport system permease protein
MECRCYNGGKGRVRMKQLKLSLVDYMAMLAVAAFGAAVVLMRIFL